MNLGDVMEDSGALYGDGVNVAARLQALAEPGGLCISGTVFDQIEGKIPLRFESIGEQAVKNIRKAVRTYRLTGSRPQGIHPQSKGYRDDRSRSADRNPRRCRVVVFHSRFRAPDERSRQQLQQRRPSSCCPPSRQHQRR